jgi:hypothetical protein
MADSNFACRTKARRARAFSFFSAELLFNAKAFGYFSP